MTAPFPARPGDKLRVTVNQPYGTELHLGDLVTVDSVGTKIEAGLPVPVVVVHTSHGRRILGLDVVEPYDLPVYRPAEKDDVVDSFFFGILGADTDLREWAVKARTDLAANDPKTGAAPADVSGGTAVVEGDRPPARKFSSYHYSHVDHEDDLLDVFYSESTDPARGRDASFCFQINDEDAVVVPASEIDQLIKYLFQMRNHSRRTEG